MATQPAFDHPVCVEHYLSTVYEHDCEFVGGVIEERGMGEFEHAFLQGILAAVFTLRRADHRRDAHPYRAWRPLRRA
jgi:hypothetical protein